MVTRKSVTKMMDRTQDISNIQELMMNWGLMQKTNGSITKGFSHMNSEVK